MQIPKKVKYPKYDVAELLGMTRLLQVTDQQMWDHLLTPTVRALLGPIVEIGKPRVIETTECHFEGTCGSNMNDHRLYGGKSDFVRFPFISTMHRTADGAFVTQKDGVKIKALGFHGNVNAGTGELIYIAALKDRRFDGSLRGNDSALLHFPYSEPSNLPLVAAEKGRSVEISIYGFQPRSRLKDATGDKEYDLFVEQPFTFLDRPDTFLKHFWYAWNTAHGPGQHACAIPDVAKHSLAGFERIARFCRYDLIEAATSHYNVAMWFAKQGYRYSFKKDVALMAAFAAGLKNIRDSGHPLTRQQQSWVCVLQHLRPVELIPPHLYLGGIQWPQNNIDQNNLWMNKALTKRGQALVPGPF